MLVSKEISKEIIGTTKTAKHDLMEQLKDEKIYAEKKFRETQFQYKKQFDAHLSRTADHVLLRDFIFVEIALAEQPHKLATVATEPFSVTKVDTHTVIMQSRDNFVEKVFVAIAL